jgi:iron complex transport system permease protein
VDRGHRDDRLGAAAAPWPTAALVGAGLAVAGATFQGIVRNPLADPYVLGTSSGAALGAALAILLPVGLTVFQFGLVNVWAFVGAIAAALLVFRLGGSGGPGGMTRLLLTGYAVGSILAALLTMAMYVSGTNLRAIFSFLLGGLAGASWERWSSPRRSSSDRASSGCPGRSMAAARRRCGAPGSRFDASGASSSSPHDRHGGSRRDHRPDRVRRPVVPHVVRLLVGAAAIRVVPISAIFGAVLLVCADLVARLLGDLPVGVVMAIIGAPFFLVLLHQTHSGYEL